MPVLTEELTQLRGHRWQVSCLGFSPDGTRLASGGWDKEVNVWELSNLEVVHSLKGAHDVPVTTLSWHRPAGLIICAGSADHTVSLWNGASGRHLSTLSEHSGWVLGSCFSATGSFLATSSWDKTVRIWDPGTATTINTLSGHTAGVWSVDFHPRSSQLCSASEDGTIKIWDARSSKIIRTLTGGHSDAIYSAKWSPDGAMIASGSADTKICVWEPSKGAVINTIYGHVDTVKSVAFNPQVLNVALPVLASAGDFTLRLSDPRPDQRADILTLKPHSEGKEVETVAISPDGSLLVSGGRDGLLVLMTLFVPSIMPRSESTFSTSSVLRRSRVVRDRSYIFDATQEEELPPELAEEDELEAEMEAEALDEILTAPKKPERQTSFNRMKRRSRYEHKQTELPDHATVRRKGVSARVQRGKRIREKVVDIPTMVAHLSAAIRAYGPEEPSSSSESEEDIPEEEKKVPVKVDVTSRVAEFSNPEAVSEAKVDSRKLSLDNVGQLRDRREMFEKKIRQEQRLKDADDTEQEYLTSDGLGLSYSMPGELETTLPVDAAYSINASGHRFDDFGSPEQSANGDDFATSPLHDPGAYEHWRQPFSPTLPPAPEDDEDLVFEDELGSGDEYGDDIPLSTI